jgi:MFS family permease
MLLSFIIWTILNSRLAATNDSEIGKGVLALIFSSLFFAVGFSPLIYTYVIEIWPYTLRGRGLAFEVSITMFGLIQAQFFNPIALKAIGWKYYILFCVLLTIFVTLVYLLSSETKGRTLEEVREIFDGKVEEVEVSDVRKKGIETIH